MSDSSSSSEAEQDSPVQREATQQSEDSDGSEDSEDSGGADNDSHGDDEGSSPAPVPPRPPPLNAEQLAMRELRKMHKWNEAKPRYKLRSLEFKVPTISPLKKTPP